MLLNYNDNDYDDDDYDYDYNRIIFIFYTHSTLILEQNSLICLITKLSAFSSFVRFYPKK